MGFTIEKETGEIKEFDIEKFHRLITRQGTLPDLIEELVENSKKHQKNLSIQFFQNYNVVIFISGLFMTCVKNRLL